MFLQVCEINLSHLQSKDTSRVDSELAQQNANSFFRFFSQENALAPHFPVLVERNSIELKVCTLPSFRWVIQFVFFSVSQMYLSTLLHSHWAMSTNLTLSLYVMFEKGKDALMWDCIAPEVYIFAVISNLFAYVSRWTEYYTLSKVSFIHWV